MQGEEIDNMDELIREASKSHHPAYDDKAWEKMEVLLNEHLPLKKDRRRPAIFFLLLLFITGTAFFAILYHSQSGYKKESVTTKNKPLDILSRSITAEDRPADGRIIAKSPTNGKDGSPAILQDNTKKEVSKDFKKPIPVSRYTNKKSHIKTSSPDDTNDVTDEKDITINDDRSLLIKEEQGGSDDNNVMADPSAGGANDQPVNITMQTINNDSIATKEAAKLDTPKSSGKPPVKNVAKKGFANNFAITFSAGPDLSFVDLGDPGKSRLNFGGGLGYSIGERFTIRAGFYFAKKTYSAKSGDYHPPDWYWTNTADLKKVDADCNVYEIPLSASYNFKQSKNHNWFAGVGFSTFLMKRETYRYLYKDSWGQTMNKTWTLRNGGNQYFSVLTISGGYQYRVNRYFSLLSEPYLKLPLHGIGFGKIKLNSGGLLFTARILPFAKK